MIRNELFELLAYLVASAAGLEGEPKIYGPLRIIEAAERLCRLMLEDDPENSNLKGLVEIIEGGKRKTMSDEAGFYQMLRDAAAKLVDCM